MKKKALVVAHGGDPDGIISAASLHRYLSSEYEVEFMYVIYFIQKEAFERISRRANLRDYEMFVVDLSLNDYLVAADNEEESIIKRIVRRAGRITWIDHHDGTQRHKRFLESLGVNVLEGNDDDKCASRLIFETLLQSDEYFNWLTSIAQNSDYPGSLPGNEIDLVGRDLYNIISLFVYKSDYKALTELMVVLSSGKDWFNNRDYTLEIQKSLESFKNEQTPALLALDESLEAFLISGKKIMIGFGSGVLSDKDTIAKVMEADKEDSDCYIISYGAPLNHALVLKGSKSDFPVKNFCSSMGGGGREYGQGRKIGGFPVSFKITSKKFKDVKDLVIRSLEDFLK